MLVFPEGLLTTQAGAVLIHVERSVSQISIKLLSACFAIVMVAQIERSICRGHILVGV